MGGSAVGGYNVELSRICDRFVDTRIEVRYHLLMCIRMKSGSIKEKNWHVMS